MPKNTQNDIKKLIKKGENLFEEGKTEEAEQFFLNLLDMYPDNSVILNNLGVIKVNKGNLDLAEKYLKSAIEQDEMNKDAIINYFSFLSTNERVTDSYPILKKALEFFPDDSELKDLADYVFPTKSSLQKIAVLCIPGLTSFLNDIVDFLKIKYEVRTCYSNDHKEIEAAIQWSDIVWLEWANELAIHITNKIPSISDKKVICRVHSYEVLGGYLNKIDWSKISNTVFVADHVLKIANELCPSISQLTKPSVIYNGLDLKKFPYRKQGPGFNISIVGFINHKKNPPMWIEILDKLVKIDDRYTLHIAGSLQDLRYKYYLENIIPKLGLTENIHFYGQVDDVANWNEMNNINYLLTTSVFESFGYVIAEAMAMGCRPLIHAFPGADQIWPKDCIFSCVDELIEQIRDHLNYDSMKYREFVENNYSLEVQLDKIDKLMTGISNSPSIKCTFQEKFNVTKENGQLNIYPDQI